MRKLWNIVRGPETRLAPARSFTRSVSTEGLSELQKALRSDDEAAANTISLGARRLQRVQSINPHWCGECAG